LIPINPLTYNPPTLSLPLGQTKGADQERAQADGFQLVPTPDHFIAFRPHDDTVRVFYEGVTNKRESLLLNRQFTQEAIQSKRFTANEGRAWGAGRVRVNFR